MWPSCCKCLHFGASSSTAVVSEVLRKMSACTQKHQRPTDTCSLCLELGSGVERHYPGLVKASVGIPHPTQSEMGLSKSSSPRKTHNKHEVPFSILSKISHITSTGKPRPDTQWSELVSSSHRSSLQKHHTLMSPKHFSLREVLSTVLLIPNPQTKGHKLALPDAMLPILGGWEYDLSHADLSGHSGEN